MHPSPFLLPNLKTIYPLKQHQQYYPNKFKTLLFPAMTRWTDQGTLLTWCRSSSTSSSSRGFPALRISPFPSWEIKTVSNWAEIIQCQNYTCGSLITIWFVIGQLIPTEFHLCTSADHNRNRCFIIEKPDVETKKCEAGDCQAKLAQLKRISVTFLRPIVARCGNFATKKGFGVTKTI